MAEIATPVTPKIGGGWLFSVAVKRVAAAGAGWIVGALTSGPVAMWLSQAGIQFDPAALKEALTGLIVLGAVALHDYIRMTNLGRKAKL